MVEAVNQQSTRYAAQAPLENLAALPDLTQPGPYFDPAAIFLQVAMAQLLPIAIGLAIHGWFPELADDLEEPVFKLGTFLLLGLIFVILIAALPKVLTMGVIPVLAAVLFAAASLIIGHFLGGPEPESRLTIAVANVSRNAGLALAIATANFQDPGILPAIATYAVFAGISGSIYSKKYQKKMPSAATEPAM